MIEKSRKNAHKNVHDAHFYVHILIENFIRKVFEMIKELLMNPGNIRMARNRYNKLT